MECVKKKKKSRKKICKSCYFKISKEVLILLPELITNLFYVNFSRTYSGCYIAFNKLKVTMSNLHNYLALDILDLPRLESDVEELKQALKTKNNYVLYCKTKAQKHEYLVNIDDLKFLKGKVNDELLIYFYNIKKYHMPFNVEVTLESLNDFTKTFLYFKKFL